MEAHLRRAARIKLLLIRLSVVCSEESARRITFTRHFISTLAFGASAFLYFFLRRISSVTTEQNSIKRAFLDNVISQRNAVASDSTQ
jgi:hypothetical protein